MASRRLFQRFHSFAEKIPHPGERGKKEDEDDYDWGTRRIEEGGLEDRGPKGVIGLSWKVSSLSFGPQFMSGRKSIARWWE